MQQAAADAIAAIDRALDRVEAGENPDERLRLLKPLAAGLQEIHAQARAIRRAEVIRLYEEEPDLSMAEIGRLTGVTKGRVHQIVSSHPWKRPVREKAAPAPPPPPVPALPEMEIGDADLATAHYRLYDAAGIFLYTGVADNLKARFDDHKAEKPWWPQVARRTVTWYGSRRDALRAEDIAIKTERPIHNIAGATSERLKEAS
jgi:predicted GIY-YIG superfamily endonuclease